MGYAVARAINPNAIDTAPNRARYFSSQMRFTLGGPQQNYTETWQVGLNFIITADGAQKVGHNIECPSVLIEPHEESGTIDGFKFHIPWWTENINTGVQTNSWLHTDEMHGVFAAWKAFWDVERVNLGGHNFLQDIRIVPFNSQNAVVAEPVVYKPATVQNGTGNASTTGLPPQIAAGITFDTGGYGRGSTGRMYWKRDAQSLGGYGLMSQVQAQSLRDHAATLLTGLAQSMEWALGPDDLVPSVIHKRTMRYSPITGVRVGRVTDTQRRRAKTREENYETVEWSLP